jgi:hypothetical protein
MRLTKRGKRVRAILIALSIALALWVAGNVWVTDTGRICLGSMTKCVGL